MEKEKERGGEEVEEESEETEAHCVYRIFVDGICVGEKKTCRL